MITFLLKTLNKVLSKDLIWRILVRFKYLNSEVIKLLIIKEKYYIIDLTF